MSNTDNKARECAEKIVSHAETRRLMHCLPDVNAVESIIQPALIGVWDEAIAIAEKVSCVYDGSKNRASANVKAEILELLDAARDRAVGEESDSEL